MATMDSCLKKRRTLKGRLTRIETFLGGQGETPIDLRLVPSYQQQLEQHWKESNDILLEIGELCDDAEFERQQTEFDQIAARIDSLKLKLLDLKVVPNDTTSKKGTSVRLPKLELPTFSGSLHEWTSFYDLFSATIHGNELLTGAQKLQYLKSALRGEAAMLLSSIQVTDDNFKEAWDILKQRYQNTREIINAHLKRLCAQQTLVSESPIGLRKLIDTTNETVRALRVLKVPVEHWDIVLVHLVAEKLDSDTRRQWELTLQTTEVVKYADFMAFLEQRARALLTCVSSRPIRSGAPQQSQRLPNRAAHHAGTSKEACRICRERHSVYNCTEFIQSSLEDRRGLARAHSLCYNCLSGDHVSKQCKAGSCRKCGGKHHTLLHLPTGQGSGKEDDDKVTTHHGIMGQNDKRPAQVLLATALVRVKDAQGSQQVCRALLDSGSQASFVTESCAQRLGLPRQRTSVLVTGINASNVSVAKGCINLRVSSCLERGNEFVVNALVLKKVTSEMPSSSCDPTPWKHVPKVNLADPQYYVPNYVDVLLGADVVAEVIQQGLRKGPRGTPIAQNSSFGWLISGQVSSGHVAVHVAVNTAQLELVTTVQRFWELEEAPCTHPLSEEEVLCETHFANTHERDSNGRFIVRLPLKTKQVVIDPRETRVAAIQRLTNVDRRLVQQPLQEKEYHDFLCEYETLGHMRMMTTTESAQANSIYLPHHAVIKEGSTTTRLRVVFDASAKARNGTSLNDHLMVGPTLQEDIFSILVRFRTYVVAITADIHKMYRQVKVHSADTRLQNIVWRPSPSEPVKDYRLLTLTYGTSSAPFLATRCLQQLAKDDGDNLPEAAAATLRDFYVDDLLSGADTVEDARNLCEQMTTLLDRGGFQLRKWASNCKDVLDSVPVELREKATPRTIDSDETIKTLGLQWCPTTDEFSFCLSPRESKLENTKRTLLSTLAKIYDPLGWLAPITVKLKIMLQQLWRTPCTWDERLPSLINEEWVKYRADLIHLESVRITRLTEKVVNNQELHGYCDASEKAYAAVIYMKTQQPDGSVKVNLVAAKTRVAPLKTISIPRLELCSALLLAKLFDSVQRAFKSPVPVIYAWTDSTVSLAWINASSSRWKTFVANRVTKIQESVPANKWHHVKGKDNPADCASRGIKPTEIVNHELWWTGPAWLHQAKTTANDDSEPVDASSQISEEEKPVIVNTAIVTQPMLLKFSSLATLKRVTAYMFRFIRNCRLPIDKRKTGPLSREELEQALFYWIKMTQQETFSIELKCFTKRQPIPNGSQLITLNPFLDTQGMIRVGGRLQNAAIPIDQKFPIVLPKKHHLTILIVRHEHLRSLHAGPQLLLFTLQQQFWILGGRDVVRQHVQQCVTCWRQRATPPRPAMGDLPAARVNPARPFSKCGVDFAGPFLLRAMKIRGQKNYKAYIAVFVCFVTHAIHLEIVSDLTTDSFIAALKRFVARRGNCSEMFSDQGTNFVGTNHELKALRKLIQTTEHNETVAHFLGESGTNWHFNPPAAPHFGGIWEAGVKSIKQHLRKVVGNVSLNYEEMATVVTQIEACLNSRPLCPNSTNPEDLTALTPGHFLIGSPLITVAEPDYTSEKMTRLSRWQLVQRLYQHFWKRWNREYLSRLQQRPRAWTKKTEIKVDDLVLIKDDNQPPSRWRLGRIVKLHPGNDEIVRVVSIKTQSGVLRRPVVKICQLPIDNM